MSPKIDEVPVNLKFHASVQPEETVSRQPLKNDLERIKTISVSVAEGIPL